MSKWQGECLAVAQHEHELDVQCGEALIYAVFAILCQPQYPPKVASNCSDLSGIVPCPMYCLTMLGADMEKHVEFLVSSGVETCQLI